MMEVQVVKGVRTIVRVSGEVDISNASDLQCVLEKAAGEAKDGLVVDTSQLSYIDATGIHAILAAWERVRDAGSILALVGGGPVIRLADVLGLDKLPSLLLCDNVVSAIERLTPQG